MPVEEEPHDRSCDAPLAALPCTPWMPCSVTPIALPMDNVQCSMPFQPVIMVVDPLVEFTLATFERSVWHPPEV